MYRGQTAGRIKMPLGTEVGLLPERGTATLTFAVSACIRINRGPILWPNGWIDHDNTLYTDVGLGPGDIALDGDPTPPWKEVQLSAAPTLWLMSIYPTVGIVKHSKNISRYDSFLLNKLRIGHSCLTHSYLLCCDDPPNLSILWNSTYSKNTY